MVEPPKPVPDKFTVTVKEDTHNKGWYGGHLWRNGQYAGACPTLRESRDAARAATREYFQLSKKKE